MRSSNSFRNFLPALLATAALILIAGVAGAVIDADNIIDPESPDYVGSTGRVDASGMDFQTEVALTCHWTTVQEVQGCEPATIEHDFDFGCRSTHIDKVKLSTKTGKVDQKTQNNNARAWLRVRAIGEIFPGGPKKCQPMPPVDKPFDLLCEKVTIKGKSNADTEEIEATCKFRKCNRPLETQLKLPNFLAGLQCLEDSEDEGTLGEKVQTIKEESDLIRGTITSKGVWLEVD